VPLAVKELRPLRGAFGVLDGEPLARHRQMEGQAGACLRVRRATLQGAVDGGRSTDCCSVSVPLEVRSGRETPGTNGVRIRSSGAHTGERGRSVNLLCQSPAYRPAHPPPVL
jgi:hypothetical protein